MRKLICTLIIFICIIWLAGVAGSLERDVITIAEACKQGLAAIIIMASNVLIGGFRG